MSVAQNVMQTKIFFNGLALRKASLNSVLSPVACGTALRNTRSVEPLLDMIVDFLPNPSERQYELPVVDLCALVFKVFFGCTL